MKTSSQYKVIDNFIELETIIGQIRSENQTIVFTNGCFDILHAGHVDYIEKASKMGDVLIIGINDDDSVKRLKGASRPIHSLSNRIKVLSALEAIDFVVAFSTDTPLELIELITPDILVKGGDYTIGNIVGATHVLENGGIVEIIDFVIHTSTTKIIKSVQKA